MQPVRILFGAALALLVVGANAQIPKIGSGNLDSTILQSNTLSIDFPPDGTIVSDCVQFSISHSNIDPGLGLDLTISRNGTGETKSISGPTFPDGGLPGLWPPCADFRIGGPFPDGAYTATARIFDLITNATVFTDTVNLVMDRTAPVISMSLTPNKDCYNAGDTNVSLQITVTDASGLRTWTLGGSGVPGENGGPENTPFNLNRVIDMSALADGAYDITFDCTDKAGFDPPDDCLCGPNSNVKTITFTVDSTAPLVDVDPPGDCLKGTVNLTWTVDNNPATTALTETRVYIDGSLKSTQDPADQDFSLNTATLSDGPHVLRVEVDDECGNTGVGTQNFSTDNTAPNITVTNPTIVDPNVCQEVNGPSVNVQFSITEESDWVLKIDGGTVAQGHGTSGSHLWTPGDFNCHNFEVTATDVCGNRDVQTFILRVAQPGDCTCRIVPNLIWATAGNVTDPFDGVDKQSFRPEVINIDDVTIRDILECHGVTIDQNLIVQAVCVTKTTPTIKCGAFLFGPGSGLNTNFDTGLVYADRTMLDDSVTQIAFGRPLGDRCLLFSPPCTLYTVCVVYVIYNPATGRVGPPIRKEMCWKVEESTKEIIRCNIEYFSTVAAGRTQKPKISEDVVAALNAALDIPNDTEALFAFETIIGLAAVDFQTFIGPNGNRDVRFVTGYLIDSDEEPIGCLLIEQANFLLWHP